MKIGYQDRETVYNDVKKARKDIKAHLHNKKVENTPLMKRIQNLEVGRETKKDEN